MRFAKASRIIRVPVAKCLTSELITATPYQYKSARQYSAGLLAIEG